jgi:hypothetical protein
MQLAKQQLFKKINLGMVEWFEYHLRIGIYSLLIWGKAVR